MVAWNRFDVKTKPPAERFAPAHSRELHWHVDSAAACLHASAKCHICPEQEAPVSTLSSLLLAAVTILAAPPTSSDDPGAELARLKGLLIHRDKEIAELKQVLSAERNRVIAFQDQMKATAEAVRAEAEQIVRNMRQQEAVLQVKIAQLEDRNAELMKALADAQRELAILKAGVKPEKPINPPRPDVQGVVQEVMNDLVRIDIGSDSGVHKGQELEVFRLKPEPKYLGKVRITDVWPNQSVGRIVKPMPTVKVQAGDRVATRIAP
jgi:hypothetical protein